MKGRAVVSVHRLIRHFPLLLGFGQQANTGFGSTPSNTGGGLFGNTGGTYGAPQDTLEFAGILVRFMAPF